MNNVNLTFDEIINKTIEFCGYHPALTILFCFTMITCLICIFLIITKNF